MPGRTYDMEGFLGSPTPEGLEVAFYATVMESVNGKHRARRIIWLQKGPIFVVGHLLQTDA